MRKTFTIKKNSVQRALYLADAKGQVLGRLASGVARILRGKHKPIYSPQVDCGDNVIVINAKDIAVSGRKLKDKIYLKYSGYPSGLKRIPLEEILKKNPPRVVRLAVQRMLPKNALGRDMLRKLRIYRDAAVSEGLLRKSIRLPVL